MDAKGGRVTGDPIYLRLDGIHKSFGKFEALQDIALEVRRGELMVFLGPSGCGKTTLLRIVAGLESQDRGLIVQDGKDISRVPRSGATTASSFSPMRCFRI